MSSPSQISRVSRDPSPTSLRNMDSQLTYNKVHEWLMKSPDPPRQLPERVAASSKSLPKPLSTPSPKPSLKVIPSSHEARPQKSFMICEVAKSVSVSEDATDMHKPGTNIHDDKNERDQALVLFDIEEKMSSNEENDDTETYTHYSPPTSTWEDAVILLLCTIHWLTVMALVCSLAGLIIAWKTGYRLGLRTHARGD